MLLLAVEAQELQVILAAAKNIYLIDYISITSPNLSMCNLFHFFLAGFGCTVKFLEKFYMKISIFSKWLVA